MAEVFNVVGITRGNVVWYIRTYTDYLRARLKLAKLNDEHYHNPEHATFAILVERQWRLCSAFRRKLCYNLILQAHVTHNPI